MIRTLRIRFIRTAMLAVILVLGLIIAAINVLNYRNVSKEADTILSMLAAHEGNFPGGLFGEPALPADSSAAPAEEPPEPDPPEEKEPAPEMDTDRNDWSKELATWNETYGRRSLMQGSLPRETPFESRYFYVETDADGTILSSDTSHIASIGEDDLDAYVAAARTAVRGTGFYDSFRFLKTSDAETTTTFFLDCSRSLNNFRAFLQLSILVSVLGLIGVFLLVYYFSGRIIQPVQESYDKQKRFITDAGHELKTPLTIIDADISVAEMESGSSEWLDDVKVQTKRLSDLTNDLIYLSRMDEGTAQLQFIDFPISDLVHDTAQSFRARVQLEEKTFHEEIDPMVTYCGDEKSIEKLLTILLDNAVKYSKEHGAIGLSFRKKQKSISLSVENEVDSVDPSTLPHMFDRFYRTDASRNSSKGGYGIGLSIAQAIVQAHKGTIEATAPAADLLRITATFPL